MTKFFEAVLGLLGVGVAWAIVGVPLSWLAIASGRRQPERAKVRAVPWAVAIAAWTALVLGVLGFLWGASIPAESAGAAAMLLLSAGCFAGVPLGGVGSWIVITRRVKGPAPLTPSEPERPALRAQRAAMALLAIGTLTSLTGLGGSLSLGLISLALAQAAVRPLATLFVVLHGLGAVLAARVISAAQSDSAKARAHSALVINVAGLLIAALIAASGPGFFEGLLKAAAKGLVR